jgi:hypothetical protein
VETEWDSFQELGFFFGFDQMFFDVDQGTA